MENARTMAVDATIPVLKKKKERLQVLEQGLSYELFLKSNKVGGSSLDLIVLL